MSGTVKFFLYFIFIPAIIAAQVIPVTFHYKPQSPGNTVYIAGDFTNYNSADPNFLMSDKDGDGTLEITVLLNKGNHFYKFVDNGKWFADPDNPVTEGQYQNSMITVTNPMITYMLPLTGSAEYKITRPPSIKVVAAFEDSAAVNCDNFSLKINNKTIPLTADNYNILNKTLTYTPAAGELIEGNNIIECNITTSAGSSDKSISFNASRLPIFKLLTEDIIYFTPDITVYGKLMTMPVSSVSIKVNGNPYTVTIRTDSIFYAQAVLTGGENNIEVSVTDDDGTKTQTQKLVYDADERPAVDVQASVSGRNISLSAGAVSPKGLPLTYEWSQPNPTPSQLQLSGTTANTLQINIPQVEGDYFLKIRVTDSQGAYNIGGCLIRSTLNDVRIVNPNDHPDWIEKAILYEIDPYTYCITSSALAGIGSKMDYLSELGINTIYLTPVFEGEGMGYWTKDYFKVAEGLGTIDDLKALVIKAHSKGIRIILDLVVNHSWTEHPFFSNVKKLKDLSPFKNYYLWSGVPGASDYDYYYDWSHLPNLNVNDNELENYLFHVAEYWIRECDIDGYRCDVAWGIEKRNPDFWTSMRNRLKKLKPDIFLLGESPVSNLHEGSRLNITSAKFDAAYDWNLRGWSNTGLPAILDGAASVNQLNSIITAPLPSGVYPLRFIENHDHPRAASLFGIPKSKLAHTITMTVNGIPLIFAGGEMGELNFEPSWTDLSNVRPYFKKLIEVHKKYIKNDAEIIQLKNTQPASVYSYVSKSDTFTVLTLANFSSQTKVFTVNFTSPDIPVQEYNVLDLINNTSTDISFARLQSNVFSLNAWEAKVYLITPLSNMIANGDFSDGLNNWSIYIDTQADAELSAADSVFTASIKNGGTEDWHIQLGQSGKKIETGKTYELSFDAYSGQDRTITVGISMDGGSNTVYDSKTVSITDKMKNYSVNLNMNNPTDVNALLFFNMGKSDISVKLDNILLHEHAISSAIDHFRNKQVPDKFALLQNYPNPFNASTIIGYDLPEACDVSLKVYNILGEEISVLVNEKKTAGKHEIVFDGNALPSSVYFYTIQAGSFHKTNKFVLLK